MSLNWLAKTKIFALMGIALLWTDAPGFAAGTLPIAQAQQIDINGQPLANCQVSFFVAGTPASQQDSFSDFGLTQKNAWPLTCDQTGRVPMFWLADGLIHVRLTDASGAGGTGGTPIIDTTMQVLGPSSGGGGGGSTVDPTTILATGDEKIRYGTGTLTGFVRENGLTIGNATSGATERANADTQALFIYLYNTDPNLVVSGGRTSNALNDYNANKQLTLPDMRGRMNAFLDDMGNSAAGRLTSGFCGPSPTTLGNACGNQSNALQTSNLPPYSPSGTVTVNSINANIPIQGQTTPGSPLAAALQGNNTSGGTQLTINFSSGTGTFSGNSQGGTSAPFGILPPMMLRTQYIKL